MAQRFRDEAGNIWETGPDGQPQFVSSGVQTKPADPRLPLQVEGAQLGNTRTAIDIQNAPIERTGKVLGNQGQGLSNQRTAQQIGLDNLQAAAALSQQFDNNIHVKRYRTMLPEAAKALAAPDNAAGDASIVYSFAKAMDPIGSVREGDTAIAQQTASLMGRLQAYVGMVNAGKRLPAQARKDLIETMRQTGAQYNRAYTAVRKQYEGFAKQGGFDPIQIIGNHDGDVYHELEKDFLRGGKKTTATGATKTEVDPKLTAVIDKMIRKGVPFEDANEFVTALNASPLNPQEYAAAVAFAKANPGYKKSLAAATITSPTTVGERIAGNVDQFLGEGNVPGLVKGFQHTFDRAAQGLEGAANMLPGINSDSAAQASQQNQQFWADRPVDPTAETIGKIGGATLFSAPLRGAMAAGAAGNMLFSDSTDAGGLVGDAALGAIGGKVGDVAVRGAAGLLAPQGREAMKRLHKEGVSFSPGRLFGGAAQKMEDRLTGLPVVGPKIEEIHAQSLNQFNRIPANRALAPIGETLPENIPAGHQAVGYTRDRLGQAYEGALSGKNIALDPTYITRMNAIGQRSNMRPQEFDEFGEIVQREVGGAFANGHGMMGGKTYKKLDSRLGQLAGDLGRSPDVFKRDIAADLLKVKDQTRALARRQNPSMGAALRATDEGYANYKILERAAASNPATGIFQPGQLRTAVKGADRSVGKGATARGEARMQDLASDGSEALTSSIGTSGTSEREQIARLTPWALGSVLSPLYSPPTIKLFEELLLRNPSLAAKLGANSLRSLPRGMFGAGAPLLINSGQGN